MVAQLVISVVADPSTVVILESASDLGKLVVPTTDVVIIAAVVEVFDDAIDKKLVLEGDVEVVEDLQITRIG